MIAFALEEDNIILSWPLTPHAGKLSQIVFAVLAPGSAVASIVAGAVAEAGAMQVGDLMQDLKTGHLLRAA